MEETGPSSRLPLSRRRDMTWVRKLASSLVNFWAHYKIVWLIDWWLKMALIIVKRLQKADSQKAADRPGRDCWWGSYRWWTSRSICARRGWSWRYASWTTLDRPSCDQTPARSGTVLYSTWDSTRPGTWHRRRSPVTSIAIMWIIAVNDQHSTCLRADAHATRGWHGKIFCTHPTPSSPFYSHLLLIPTTTVPVPTSCLLYSPNPHSHPGLSVCIVL